ncbi:MAG: alpha/beta hydrolase [Rhodovibrionaceae bacterium]
MPLDPGILKYIEITDKVFPPDFLDSPIGEQRQMYADLAKSFDYPRPESIEVEDKTVGPRKVAVRIFRPEKDPARQGKQPCLFYMHGGGYVFGNLDSHDSITAEIAERAGVTVISIDYSLAPEKPHPAACEDCWSVILEVTANPELYGIDPDRLAVAGDSAGGNLSGAMCLKARAAGGPRLSGQVLIYPGFGLELSEPARCVTPDAPGFSRAEHDYYRRAYLGGAETTDDPLAFPLLNNDYTDLPPAYVVVAQYDPLRDDGEVYSDRLCAAGVNSELHLGRGLIHGFLRARHMSKPAGEAFEGICKAVGKFLRD